MAPAIWPLLASAAFVSALGVYLWRRRSTPGATPLALITLLMAVACLANAAELAAVEGSTKQLWFLVRGSLVFPAVVVALWFAVQYARLERLLTRPVVAVLLGSAIGWVVLSFVDGGQLMWSELVATGSVHGDLTPIGVAFAAYGWVVFALGTVVLVVLGVRSPAHRAPVVLMVAGQVAIRIAVPLGVLDVARDPNALIMLSFDFAALMYAVALTRFRMFDLVPVARATILDRMPDAMLVLDLRGRIKDLNRAAAGVLRAQRADLLGRHVDTALAQSPELARAIADAMGSQGDVCVAGSGASFQVSATVLQDWQGAPIGRLILLHDLGELRRAQDRLVRQARTLAKVHERELIARELHDRIGQVLAYIGFEADAARKRLADGDVAAADGLIDRLAGLAREGHAEVRACIEELQATPTAGPAFLANVRRLLDLLREHASVHTELVVDPAFDDGSLPPEAQSSLLRILQQALTNIAVHGGAERVRLGIDCAGSRWRIAVEDDGAGFDVQALAAGGNGHHGIASMRARAQELGGIVEVSSTPGKGTTVLVWIPREPLLAPGEPAAAAAGRPTVEAPALAGTAGSSS